MTPKTAEQINSQLTGKINLTNVPKITAVEYIEGYQKAGMKLIGTCKNCKSFVQKKWGEELHDGICRNKNVSGSIIENTTVTYYIFDENFGCIYFETKERL